MMADTEYKQFRISLRPQRKGWTATIAKLDSALLFVNSPASENGPMQTVTIALQETAIEAMKLALDLIDSGRVF